jgi:hypothetical protein
MFLAAPVMRTVARMEFPSTKQGLKAAKKLTSQKR